MARRRRIFGNFLSPVFSASRVQHVSDLHPKFDTDHLPVVSTLVIRLKWLSRKKNVTYPKYNLEALEDKQHATSLNLRYGIATQFSVMQTVWMTGKHYATQFKKWQQMW